MISFSVVVFTGEQSPHNTLSKVSHITARTAEHLDDVCLVMQWKITPFRDEGAEEE